MLLSDSYVTKDVMFMWRNIEKPVQIRKGLHLPEFNLTKPAVGDCTAGYNTGISYNHKSHKNHSTLLLIHPYFKHLHAGDSQYVVYMPMK